MQVKPERLAGVLARPVLPGFFLVFGEEPLQRTESVDAIRAAVRAARVDERLVFDAAVGLDWAAVEAEAGSLSLFASKRLIEIHLGGRKPDKQGIATLKALTALQGEDVWLVTADALGREEQASEWYRAIEGRGVVVACRLLENQAFRDWLAARAQACGRRLAPAAVEVLALRAEGNLLAAAQEIDKLVLLVDTPTLDAEQVLAAVADSTRYDPFKLVDAALAGDTARTIRMIRGLRAEGQEPVLLSWLVNRELRLLSKLADAGRNLDAQFAAERVWQSRQPLLRRALQRLPPAALVTLLRDSLRVDMLIKGVAPGQPWDELESLYVALAGGPWLGELALKRAEGCPVRAGRR